MTFERWPRESKRRQIIVSVGRVRSLVRLARKSERPDERGRGREGGELTFKDVNFGCIGFLAPADDDSTDEPEPEAVPGAGSRSEG